MMNNFNYILPESKQPIDFYVDNSSFLPTATSDFLIKSCLSKINFKVNDLLDLGCGIGIVGISLYKSGRVFNLFSSDLSENSVSICKKNSSSLDVKNTVLAGDCLDPWGDMKFDVIVDDISGISETVAKLSSWFSNVPCNSGIDGTNLTLKVLKQAPSFLKPNGILFFPVISLSNREKIINNAQSIFGHVEKLASHSWFLPDDLMEHIGVLNELKKEGLITFDFKFGKYLCYTDIYIAYN